MALDELTYAGQPLVRRKRWRETPEEDVEMEETSWLGFEIGMLGGVINV